MTGGGRDLVTVHGRVVYRLPRDARIVTPSGVATPMNGAVPCGRELGQLGLVVFGAEAPSFAGCLNSASGWPLALKHFSFFTQRRLCLFVQLKLHFFVACLKGPLSSSWKTSLVWGSQSHTHLRLGRVSIPLRSRLGKVSSSLRLSSGKWLADPDHLAMATWKANQGPGF